MTPILQVNDIYVAYFWWHWIMVEYFLITPLDQQALRGAEV